MGHRLTDYVIYYKCVLGFSSTSNVTGTVKPPAVAGIRISELSTFKSPLPTSTSLRNYSHKTTKQCSTKETFKAASPLRSNKENWLLVLFGVSKLPIWSPTEC